MKTFFAQFKSEGEEILEEIGVGAFWWKNRDFTWSEMVFLQMNVINILFSLLFILTGQVGIFSLQALILSHGLFMIAPFVSRSILPSVVGYWFSR